MTVLHTLKNGLEPFQKSYIEGMGREELRVVELRPDVSSRVALTLILQVITFVRYQMVVMVLSK